MTAVRRMAAPLQHKNALRGYPISAAIAAAAAAGLAA
jgi:hypothetical protein